MKKMNEVILNNDIESNYNIVMSVFIIIIQVTPSINQFQVNLLNIIYSIFSNSPVTIIPSYISECLYFCHDNLEYRFEGKTKHIMIIDFGFNDCSIALLDIEKVFYIYFQEKCKVVKTVCDNNVGGCLIDNLLYNNIIQKIKNYENGSALRNIPENIRKIKREIIKCKEELSEIDEVFLFNYQYEIHIDGLLTYENGKDIDYSDTFNRNELKELLIKENVIDKILFLIKKCLDNDTIDINQFEIAITGGSSYIKCIGDNIKEYYRLLGSYEFNVSLQIDECNSNGCIFYDNIKNNIWDYNIECNTNFNENNLTKINSLIKNMYIN